MPSPSPAGSRPDPCGVGGTAVRRLLGTAPPSERGSQIRLPARVREAERPTVWLRSTAPDGMRRAGYRARGSASAWPSGSSTDRHMRAWAHCTCFAQRPDVANLVKGRQFFVLIGEWCTSSWEPSVRAGARGGPGQRVAGPGRPGPSDEHAGGHSRAVPRSSRSAARAPAGCADGGREHSTTAVSAAPDRRTARCDAPCVKAEATMPVPRSRHLAEVQLRQASPCHTNIGVPLGGGQGPVPVAPLTGSSGPPRPPPRASRCPSRRPHRPLRGHPSRASQWWRIRSCQTRPAPGRKAWQGKRNA